ncbi:MAG TPA: hypothetical protein V6D10_20605 [Trichocoleus sp.]|jgi:hypothetical protein
MGLKDWLSGKNGSLEKNRNGAGDSANLPQLARSADNGGRLSPKHPPGMHYFTPVPLPQKTRFFTPMEAGAIKQIRNEMEGALPHALEAYKDLSKVDDMGTQVHGAHGDLTRTHIRNTTKQDQSNYKTLNELQKARLAALGMQTNLSQHDDYVAGAIEAVGAWEQIGMKLLA